MIKKMLVVGFGVAIAVSLAGCDEEMLAKAAPDAAKFISVSQGLQAGGMLMDQLQTRDRLRDGSGVNCPDPDRLGTCDAAGPHGRTGYGENGGGYGKRTGGGDRLRDGSCGD